MSIEETVWAKDAATEMGFHVEHVRRLLRTGELRGRKIGRRWKVTRESMDAYGHRDTPGTYRLACEWMTVVSPDAPLATVASLLRRSLALRAEVVRELLELWAKDAPAPALDAAVAEAFRA